MGLIGGGCTHRGNEVFSPPLRNVHTDLTETRSQDELVELVLYFQ